MNPNPVLTGLAIAMMALPAGSAERGEPLPAIFTDSVNGDGVAISDDGLHWHPVFDGPDQVNGSWVLYTVDLAAEAAALMADREPGDVQFDEESGEG